jgi:basic amino acid/polyamine antiporter, APA family
MQEQLKRSIGVFGLAAAVVNMTIGTGIFVLPALAYEQLGNAAILSFLVCGALIFLIALCFAEAGSKISVSGGPYTYIEVAFGKYAGFLANIIFLLCCVLSDAAAANALSKTLSFFWPVMDTSAVKPVLFFVLFGGLAYINIRGVQQGMLLIIIATIGKLIPLLLIVAWGFTEISFSNFAVRTEFTVGEIGAATLILFYAFLGIETAVSNGGEFKNPSRTVPLGILGGLLFVLIIYILIQLITQGVLGAKILNEKSAPLAAVSTILFGKTGAVLLIIGTAVSIIGTISSEVLGIPRVMYAGARDGLLPKFLFTVHTKYVTPHYAILLYTAIGFLIAVFGAFKQLIILTSATTLLVYLGVVLSVIQLRRKKTAAEKSFVIPGGIIVPVVAAITIVWVLSNLSKQELIGLLMTLAVLSVIYVLMQVVKRKRIQRNVFETEKDNTNS